MWNSVATSSGNSLSLCISVYVRLCCQEMKHVFALSVFLRIALISQVSSDWFSERVELSTPLNSWTRCENDPQLVAH